MRDNSGQLLQALPTVCEAQLEDLKNQLINMVRISHNKLFYDTTNVKEKC